MAERDTLIAKAAALPLKDAAYFLWINRSKIDPSEPLLDSKTAYSLIETRAGVELLAGAVNSLAKDERDNVQRDGPIFERLMRWHGELGETAIGDAIRTAMALDDEAWRFAWQSVKQSNEDGVTYDTLLERLRLAGTAFAETRPEYLVDTLAAAWSKAQFQALM